MTRRLRPLLLLACLMALPVLASEGLGSASTCPATPPSEGSTVQVETPAPREARDEVKAGGGEAATERSATQRLRPRWHSFLPGMVR